MLPANKIMINSCFKGKYGPLLIAEIGGNHEGDFAYARKLVEQAVDSPADCVKLQLYTGDTLVNPLESPQRNQHFKKFELSQEEYIELAQLVTSSGKLFTASVWNESFLDWIDPYMSFYKIGSGDLTAYPLIEKIVQRGKPIVLSTGLSTEQEVLDVIKFIQAHDPVYKQEEWLGVLQCTSMYPIQDTDCHLAVMSRLRELTNLTIGYSDHTTGYKALAYAVAMGARILEFHFTDQREGKVFRDHQVSLTPEEIKALVNEIVYISAIQGLPHKKPLAIEIENDHLTSFRRAVYPMVDIPEGTVIRHQHLCILRPNHGIGAEHYYELLGKKSRIELKKFQPLQWDFFT